jgi:tripartite-type tricarboxylate transporter receptor subunit TctC
MLRLLRFLALACASLALFALPATVQAQCYLTRAITIIVPYPAGGPIDTVARFLASKLNESFGIAVIVDNRPGAGGLLGTQYAARAEKDGHTLLLTTSIVTNLVMFKEPGYRYEDMIRSPRCPTAAVAPTPPAAPVTIATLLLRPGNDMPMFLNALAFERLPHGLVVIEPFFASSRVWPKA